MRKKKIRPANVLTYVILIFGALLILFPLYITLITPLKTAPEFANSFFAFPSSFYTDNYARVLSNPDLYSAYKNTFVITICSLFLEMVVMPPMAFALSRGMNYRKGFKYLYYFLLLGIFLPWQVRMMPLVKLMGALGLMNIPGTILIYLGHATCESTFLYVGYLATVPIDLEESARIDGASTFTTFYRIIFPLMRPILATVMIREGLAIWNDYQMPLVILNASPKSWTLSLFMNSFKSAVSIDYTTIFTVMVVVSLPIVIFYLFMQKQIMGGLTNGAVKG